MGLRGKLSAPATGSLIQAWRSLSSDLSSSRTVDDMRSAKEAKGKKLLAIISHWYMNQRSVPVVWIRSEWRFKNSHKVDIKIRHGVDLERSIFPYLVSSL